MSVIELRDSEQAERYLQQGLWLARVVPPDAAQLKTTLEWALEMAAAGEPLLPLGVIADVGHVTLGTDDERQPESGFPRIPGWPTGLVRRYEDYFLGKLYSDSSFDRAASAVRRLSGRDRMRGLAVLLNHIREHAALDGALLSPAIIKTALEGPADPFLTRGWNSLSRQGLALELVALYESIVAGIRNTGEMLGPEDVFELEHGTALAEFSQRVALRQVIQAAAALEAKVAPHPASTPGRYRDVPTNILVEDMYPVGGFASIANHGSVESLLQSQLAFMEPADRPDLFDVKYVRDELLFYARDENQFLRRRRSFVFALFPDLIQTRFKDPELPWQRIILLLGLLVTAVRKFMEWLSADALCFDFLMVRADDASPLAPEKSLLEMVLRDSIARGTVQVQDISADRLALHCCEQARRSVCHCLTVAADEQPFHAEGICLTHLRLQGAVPVMWSLKKSQATPAGDDHLDSWCVVLQSLLADWL
jgi:hypothetical protein